MIDKPLTYLTEAQRLTAEEVLRSYNLNLAQQKMAWIALEQSARNTSRQFKAYDEMHIICAQLRIVGP